MNLIFFLNSKMYSITVFFLCINATLNRCLMLSAHHCLSSRDEIDSKLITSRASLFFANPFVAAPVVLTGVHVSMFTGWPRGASLASTAAQSDLASPNHRHFGARSGSIFFALEQGHPCSIDVDKDVEQLE